MKARFVLTSVLLSSLAIPAQERLTPELLWQLQRVSDPQPSPDGRYLLHAVTGYELAKNRGNTQLWVIDLGTGERRQLTTQGSNFNGRWAPDGSMVAFLSTRGGPPQIYKLAMDGGEAVQVTRHEGGVANMSWSPDGAHFAFTSEVRLDPTLADRHPDLPLAQARIYDQLPIRHWDEWKEGTYSHLFVVPATGGEARDLMPGERFDTPVKPFGGGEQLGWSPDGQELCYTAKKVDGSAWVRSTNNDLWVVPVGGGEARNITDGAPGYDQEPAYSPDGRYIAYLSMARAGFEADRNRIMLYERATGTITELTEGFDQSAHNTTWSPDSQTLFFDSDTKGTTQIYRVDAAGGTPRPVTQGRYHFTGAQAGPNGRRLYALRQRTERPFEIVQLDANAVSAGTALTDANGEIFAKLEQPKVEERWFDATDGHKIHSWVVYPPDFDPQKQWPMLLYCQGGPQSQVGQWFSYRWNFHLMAAQGYIVLAVNRRGLPGFGQSWNDQISRDWGGQAMRDLLTATDAMLAEPYVDAQRTGAIGASFGGYTIYWLMGHDERDRFKAMVAHCGVFNLESMYGSTEELFFVDWDLGGPYWQSEDILKGYRANSPHMFAGQWDTPLLVVHGQRDFRVPVEQGLQAFTVAQTKGVPSRFLYYPDEGHWVQSPQNGVLWHREFFGWLDQYLKPTRGAAPSAKAEAKDDDGRRYLLERVDDTAVAQLYADGFEQLSLRDKMLCYHLANAAIAGRDIFLDQKFGHALQIRDVLEELYVHRAALTPETRAEVERYTKLFWVHNGIHNAITTKKEILELDADEYAAAIHAAMADGARFGMGPDQVKALHAIMTDPATYVSCTNKSPGEGKDPVLESANNLYMNVSSADLTEIEEQNPLNSRVVKLPDGRIVEQIYRAGDGKDIPPGLYAKELNAVIGHLEAALPFAPQKTQVALRNLIRFYRTGAVEDWRAFNIAWVKDTDSVVDQINGFIEVYLDARGQKGAWEAVVSFLNPEQSKMIQALAKQAQWFEDRMPWDPEFKKQNVKGISARVISVITETGDSGPITPIGINLPNEADIRQDHGSKSVSLGNVIKAYEGARAGGSVGEFAWSPEEVARAEKWSALSGDIHTNLHEVVGHASGQIRAEIQNPASVLGTYYSTLEEGRADLVGLYWIADPKLAEMGIVPHPDAALAEYEGYARNALVQLRRVALGDRVEEDHMRNRQMIVHWLIENSDAIKVEKRDGKTYYRVTSAEAFRKGCGELLAEVMRIKATGDFKAGKALVDKYGTFVDRAVHEEVLARLEKLNLPAVTGFVQPELRLVHDDAGKVTDVEVFYPMSIADQMLRWSGRQR